MIHEEFKRLLSMQFKTHPWHGVSPGESAPERCQSYIEIVPTSPVKLELAKKTGHLHVDRPQRFSSMCPMLYGFVPQTYCGTTIADLCMSRTGLKGVTGDGDPLDICILTERDFAHGDLFVTARPIGGLRMVDKNQADDKIIAVLEDDIAYGGITDIKKCPPGIIDRLKHYFLSYKRPPGSESKKQVVEIPEIYGRKDAFEVIRRSMVDYNTTFGTEEERLEALKRLLVNAVIEEMKAQGLVLNPLADGAQVSKQVKARFSTKTLGRITNPNPRGRGPRGRDPR